MKELSKCLLKSDATAENVQAGLTLTLTLTNLATQWERLRMSPLDGEILELSVCRVYHFPALGGNWAGKTPLKKPSRAARNRTVFYFKNPPLT
ncbi:hypothetical protein SKAU_G00366410 [Synaphobranchus kaupii]|uniref:Uncharacterized protein n=1 Tax=Synaphobranchus kaupii TaxID=118154 RepID=A0A9Q1EF77_SYNKA|nr:hypothetical protein SKAU_G00366410 [Synaphobranchus kaupii]